MLPVTISAPGYDPVTVNLTPSGQGAPRPDAPPPVAAGPAPIMARFVPNEANEYRSTTYPAGGRFAIAITIADSDTTADGRLKLLQFSDVLAQRAFKEVIIGDDPNSFVGVPVMATDSNTGARAIAINEPARAANEGAINLATGTHYIMCQLNDEGAVVVVLQ